MNALEKLMAVAELALKPDMSGVHLLRLEGLARDPALFTEYVRERELAQGEAFVATREFSQVMTTGADVVTGISVTALVLTLRTWKRGWCRWYLAAGSRTPWVPDSVVALLEKMCPDPMNLADTMGVFPYAASLVAGPGPAKEEITRAAAADQRQPTIIAHAPDRQRRVFFERGLDELNERYRGLVNFMVYDDPRGKGRAQYVSGFDLDQSIGITRNIPMPPVGGMVAIIPDNVPKHIVPDDLVLTLSRGDSDKGDAVVRWTRRIAALRLHPDWPHTVLDTTHERAILLYLSRLKDAKVDMVLARDYLDVQKGLTRTAQLLTEALRRCGDQTTTSEQLAAKVEDLKATLDDLNTRYHHQKAIIADYEAKAERWHATDLDALEKELAETRAALAKAEADAEMFARYAEQAEQERDRWKADAQRAQEQARWTTPAPQQDEGEGELYAPPENWAQLPDRAKVTFQWIYFSDHAFDRVARELASHKQAGKWLETAWTALVALERYAIAKAEVRGIGVTPGAGLGSLRAYLERHPVEGLPETKVVLTESELVRKNPQFRGARIFLGPKGAPVFMEARIALGGSGRPAPQLHFLDDTDGETRTVWVGYIGPHLPNSLT